MVYFQAILDKLDHKNLDVDVEYFQNVIRYQLLILPC